MASLTKYIKSFKGFKKVEKKKFSIGDSVSWVVNGSERTGKIIEIVPRGCPPKNKIYRKTVTSTRDHESYVVQSESHIVWPHMDSLQKAVSGSGNTSRTSPVVSQVAAKGVAQARSSRNVDASDYIRSLEDAVISLSKAYLFNRDLFRSESGRGILFEEIKDDSELEPLYELKADGAVKADVVKGILRARGEQKKGGVSA